MENETSILRSVDEIWVEDINAAKSSLLFFFRSSLSSSAARFGDKEEKDFVRMVDRNAY